MQHDYYALKSKYMRFCFSYKADPDVYQRLIKGLRKHATNPKLTEKQIIKEFECVGFDQGL